MAPPYFKGYWMVTNRCNLRCKYCVLENASYQLRAELNLQEKKELVSHLYHKLGFRRLTLSGGEVLIFGKHPPHEFMELLRHIRTFKSSNPSENLEIELYTNGTYLTETVLQEMVGVVDMVAVTIDSSNNNFLSEIGRNYKGYKNYYDQIVRVCGMLSKAGITLKLHSVVSTKNHEFLPDEVGNILDAIHAAGGDILYWKFYQYMSYDAPEVDKAHSLEKSLYDRFQKRVEQSLKDHSVKLHFKDNEEMNASLFNILSYGNAQYMRDGDNWTSSKRTEDLRTYNSMADLFAAHDIDEDRFRRFHELKR